MKVTTFTDTMIKKLKPTDKKYIRGEGNGFTIRVMPSGVKTWLYIYALNDKRREMNLGSYPDVELEKARERFNAAKKKVKNGIDPIAEEEAKLKESLELSKACTFDELAKDYITENVEGQVVARSLYDIKRVLLGAGKDDSIDDFKELRHRKAASITFEDVSKLLKKVATRSAASARNIIKTARPMFAYAVARKIVTANPFEMHKVNTFLPKAVKSNLKPTVKNRTLDDAEIKALWKALQAECIGGNTAKDALRLLLLTGQRPTEVLGMHSDELSGNWWTLPRERTKARLDKQRRDHAIYLVPEAISIINEKKGLIFESRTGDDHITVNALGNMIRKNKYFGLAPWGAHDLRRTVRTYMSDIDGISMKAAEAVLNHALEGTMKNYDQHKYHRQIENALKLWRDRLEGIIGEPLLKPLPDNVISIKQGRKKAA